MKRGRRAGLELAAVEVDVVADVQWCIGAIGTEQVRPLARHRIAGRFVLDAGLEGETIGSDEDLEHHQWRGACKCLLGCQKPLPTLIPIRGRGQLLTHCPDGRCVVCMCLKNGWH